jgi:hypothetical protein
MIQNRTRMEDQPRQSASGKSSPTWSSQCCEYVEENPATAVLVGFGLGVGAGLLLSCLFGSSDSYADRAESFAQRIGHQVKDSLDDMIPKSWKNRLHS